MKAQDDTMESELALKKLLDQGPANHNKCGLLTSFKGSFIGKHPYSFFYVLYCVLSMAAFSQQQNGEVAT